MIAAVDFLESLKEFGVNFFSGVPDSLLKELNFAINKFYSKNDHITAASEGNAIGHAIGNFLATGNMSVVYMQNSGLGNAYNPLVSLADPSVFGVPMLLLIGWRGEINNDGNQIKDEPQHKVQGLVTIKTLENLKIPHQIFNPSKLDWKIKLKQHIALAESRKGPVALIIRKNTFEKSKITFSLLNSNSTLSRENAIRSIVKSSKKTDFFVASTGMISRELFEIRKQYQMSHNKDLLVVGGMGHVSQIACRIASVIKKHRIFCLDGDGSLLMHMGGMAQCAELPNFFHIILNNGAHDSVGGQPTKSFHLNWQKIASGFGYTQVHQIFDNIELVKILKNLSSGSAFIEIRCKRGNRSNIGRPEILPSENLTNFMNFIKRIKN